MKPKCCPWTWDALTPTWTQLRAEGLARYRPFFGTLKVHRLNDLNVSKEDRWSKNLETWRHILNSNRETCTVSVYIMYRPCVFYAYTMYISCVYIYILHASCESIMHMSCIYHVYQWIVWSLQLVVIHEIRSNPTLSGGNSWWPASCTESGLETAGHCGGLRFGEGWCLICRWHPLTGIIELPILGGIKQCKSMVILRDFRVNNALFGLVIHHDPCNMVENPTFYD